MALLWTGTLASLNFIFLFFQVEASTPIVTQVSEPVDLGEGPVWDELGQVLYYCDVNGKALHRLDPKTNKEQVISFDQKLSMVQFVKGYKYNFVLALDRDLSLLTWNYNTNRPYSLTRLLTVESDSPGSRFNEGKPDARGRIFAGTKGPEDADNNSPPGAGTLYRINLMNLRFLNPRAVPVVTNVTISNGLVWSLDNSILYFIDTPTRRVDAFDFDLVTGDLSNRRVAFDFDKYSISGIPDGMTIDLDGNLWVACIGPGLVIKVDPVEGTLLQTVQLPVTDVTSVSFGGEDMSTLYVTTKKPVGWSSSTATGGTLDGALFKVEGLGVRGPFPERVVINRLKPLTRTIIKNVF